MDLPPLSGFSTTCTGGLRIAWRESTSTTTHGSRPTPSFPIPIPAPPRAAQTTASRPRPMASKPSLSAATAMLSRSPSPIRRRSISRPTPSEPRAISSSPSSTRRIPRRMMPMLPRLLFKPPASRVRVSIPWCSPMASPVMLALATVTLGGATISNDAAWPGKWTSLGLVHSGKFALTVESTTAVIVRIRAASAAALGPR